MHTGTGLGFLSPPPPLRSGMCRILGVRLAPRERQTLELLLLGLGDSTGFVVRLPAS
ncbi:hypothetical protein [Corallococcus sp. AB049A]|uniref:hypothetical protein n=1 Tax=Corallococcus sp. AB049A TaxID=2316721 RepID=UPI001315A106|nr:hypothetical protein [Corallococcus sp. AB049A]